MSDKTSVKVEPSVYAGRLGYAYQVGCEKTGRPIASGWCATEALAYKMAEKMSVSKDTP